MKKKIRIALYSRKSKYTDKGDSIANQIELMKEYIYKNYSESEYEIEIIIYEDEGFSGGNIDRPQFKKFLVEEEKNPFDILICYRLDRISRNIANFSNLIEELEEKHTNFISIKEQFDTSTPMGRAMMYIASVFAQLEREVITERIRDNMIELAKTGRWLGGITPTGFKSERYDLVDIYEQDSNNIIEKKKKKACKLIEEENELKVIDLIYSKFLELKSLSKLETYMIQNRITTKKGKNYSVGTLRFILTNPVYTKNQKCILEYFKEKGIKEIYAEGDRKKFDGRYGIIAYNKVDGDKIRKTSEWLIAVGLHKGRINGEDWIKAQELIEKNKDRRYRAKCKNQALFSGILKCLKCNSFMRPKMAGGKTKENREKRFYYTCELKEKSRGKKCDCKNISGLELDKLVIEKIEKIAVPNLAISKELQALKIKKNKDPNEEQEQLKRIYKQNKEEMKNLVNNLKYIKTDVTKIVNEELGKIKKENDEIAEKIRKIEENKIENKKELNNFVISIVQNYFKYFDKLDLKLKKDILKLIIMNIKGIGQNIEIDLKTEKIDENIKKLISSD